MPMNRLKGDTGTCASTSRVRVCSVHPHFGEERPLVVLGNSIYERSATALPDFPIQHTLPARDGGSGDSQCPASTIISGRRRDPTSAEETLLSPKQYAEI